MNRRNALECGSPVPLSNSPAGRIRSQSARGLAQCKTWRSLAASVVFLAAAFTVCSQSNSISWVTVDGGGGASAGGGLSVSGTIGQPDAGLMAGGGFRLAGGYWGRAAVFALPAPLQLTPTNATIAARRSLIFIASGGLPPYTFSFVSNLSGGSLNSTNGFYTAGTNADVADVVRVTDLDLKSAAAVVNVVTLTPLVQELFDGPGYNVGASLSGLDGGFGFAGPWPSVGGVIQNSLSFGSFPSGGAAAHCDSGGGQGFSASRPLASRVWPAAGQTFWMSYLILPGNPGDAGCSVDGQFLVELNGGGDFNRVLFLDLVPNDGTNGVHSDGVFPDGPAYLIVAKFSNYANGSPVNPQTGTAWGLTSAQYEALANAGFTEAALDSNNTARITQSIDYPMAFTNGMLTLGGYSGTKTVVDFDEIRLGASLLSVMVPPRLVVRPDRVTVAPGQTQTLTAYGGTPPYTFSLVTNHSGGSISPGNATNGLYTAGPTLGTLDTVQVRDADGTTVLTTVTVLDLLVQESFAGPGYTNGASLGGLEGGFGFAGPWGTGSGVIRDGLSFGTFPSGSAAVDCDSGGGQAINISRPLAPTVSFVTGQTFWMSFLIQPIYPGHAECSVDDQFKVGLGGGGGYGIALSLALEPSSMASSASVLPEGQVCFLVVAKFSNYANGSPADPQTATAWALTAADYAALANTGFTEAALESNHTARATQSLDHPVAFPRNLLTLDGYSGTHTRFDFDEIRIGLTPGAVLPLPALLISPASATVVVGKTQIFVGSGGTPPYLFTLISNNSGSSLDSGTGLYTAGPNAGVADGVRVTDANGSNAVATVQVVPPTFVVKTTAADGPGSLRQAIVDANATLVSVSLIRFAIPGSPPFTILPLTPLPDIARPVVLDATTQAGYTNLPVVELSGAIHGGPLAGDGLRLMSSNCVVRGLAINQFAGAGLRLDGTGGHVIQGNFIGTDPSGLLARTNGYGILVFSDNNLIGGTNAAALNLISANTLGGINLSGLASGNVIQGNVIGADLTSTLGLGSQFGGVDNLGGFNIVGGTSPGAGNVIAFNAAYGVRIQAGVGNQIRGNSIFSNHDLGIDLSPLGVTPNDLGDGDTGPNNLQNFPLITAVFASGTNALIRGTLNSTPNGTFALDFYADTSGDASGFGEGERYLGSTNVTTDAAGNTAFGFTPAGGGTSVALTDVVTATATDAAGNTSEFSPWTHNSPAPLVITPAAITVAVGQTLTFNAAGGLPPYTFSFVTNRSGGSLDSASGIYIAGSTGNVADGVRVTDGNGSNALATVTVTLRTTFAVSLIDRDSVGPGSIFVPSPSNPTLSVIGPIATNVVTDGSWNVRFDLDLVVPGTYTFIPSKPYYAFSPPFLTLVFTNAVAQPVSVTFTGAVVRVNVTGLVQDGYPFPLSDVRLTLSTAGFTSSQAVKTGQDGRYSFQNLRSDTTYSVVPAKTDYTFSPSFVSLLPLATSRNVDFTGTFGRPTISGRIADTNGLSATNQLVKLTGPSYPLHTVVTDAAGRYSFTNLPATDGYLVTPASSLAAFIPSLRQVSVLGRDAAADFQIVPGFRISGQLTSGAGVVPARLGSVGVFFYRTGFTNVVGSALTTASGSFSSRRLPAGWDYIVRPSDPNLTFAPPALLVLNLSADRSGINFTANSGPVNISGRVTNSSGFGLSAATMQLTGGGTNLSTTVDEQGRYTFRNVTPGQKYAVSASQSNFQFTPPSAFLPNVTVSRTQDFLGVPPFPLPGRIAFLRAGGLAMMNADGSGLLQPPVPPGWYAGSSSALSPDGTLMVYSAISEWEADLGALVMQNLDGSGATAFLIGGIFVDRPAWSPDGLWVGVQKLGSVVFAGSWSPVDNFLFFNVYSGYSDWLTSETPQFPRHDVVWSPDGTRLAFDDSRGVLITGTNGLGTTLLIPTAPVDSGTNGVFEFEPAWSPDGTQIACAVQSGTFDYINGQRVILPSDFGISIESAFGGVGRRLTSAVTHGNRQDQHPAWSPDGSLLAFDVDQDSAGAAFPGGRIMVVRTNGTMETPLADGRWPSWSRDPSANMIVSYNMPVASMGVVT
ncbi:MAG: carboxypeptidase regulatory-like domain-containing protein, partial [Verrucomicrobia bacterium]|nr:carboxypeptidase regulatory-like domain-containing protein [Verrucomicrobiota bacterium]